jgi:simple sugar transport system permease protein
VDIALAAILFATPLLVAAVGELFVERGGVVNIGIEGMMLAGALAAWVGNASYGPWAGFVAAVLAAIVLALLFALATLVFAADQIVTGTGVNLLALGLTALIYKRIDATIDPQKLTAISPYWMTLAALLLVAFAYAYFRFTRRGLELRAIGEAPHAADSAGLAVNRRKLLALVFGAACAGLAGAYLSTMRVQGFVENMTEGQGFLALAIVIFGRWHAGGVLAAAMFFGFVRAATSALEAKSGLSSANTQLLKMLPYVVSLLALAGMAGRSATPAALGQAYVRE